MTNNFKKISNSSFVFPDTETIVEFDRPKTNLELISKDFLNDSQILLRRSVHSVVDIEFDQTENVDLVFIKNEEKAEAEISTGFFKRFFKSFKK